MERSVTNEIGKPKVSLAANRALCQAGLPMSFENSQPLASKAIKNQPIELYLKRYIIVQKYVNK